MRRPLKISLLLISALLLGAVAYNFYPQGSLATNASIDSIVVEKAQHSMSVYDHGELLKTYRVALGSHPIGHKEREGDGKTPEGRYTIFSKTTQSRFHKNLGVSYPNAADIAHAKAGGYSPGGNIKIHGLQFGNVGRMHTLYDWTAGCIAVTNEEIDELYEHVAVGTSILILP